MSPTPAEIRARRLAFVQEHLRCPHCDEPLDKWDVPENPFSDWTAEFIYVCVRPECPYHRRSVEAMARNGAVGGACCFVYDPSRAWCGPMASRVPPRPQGQPDL